MEEVGGRRNQGVPTGGQHSKRDLKISGRTGVEGNFEDCSLPFLDLPPVKGESTAEMAEMLPAARRLGCPCRQDTNPHPVCPPCSEV